MSNTRKVLPKINRFIRGILDHSILIIIITIAITVFMAFQAVKVEMDTNFNTLMPQENDRITLIREKLGVETEQSSYLFLSISDDSLFDLELLGTFQNTIDDIMEIPGFESVLSPFNFIYFETDRGRVIPGTLSSTGKAPVSAEELADFEQRINSQSLSENFVVSDGGRAMSAMFLTRSEIENQTLVEEFQRTILPLEQIVDVHYTGELPFKERVAYHLSKDFSILLLLALVAMLAIFWLSFRSVRAVVLPVIVVVIGAVWSVGFMSMVGYPITVVSVIIPSLILTIGSSYTIHVLSEYYRNIEGGDKDRKQALADAVEHVIRTVIIAALTTMVCFLSLLTTSLQPLQEFGLSISLGIFFCAILALFFLPAVFSLLPTPKAHHQERIHNGFLTRAVTKLGGWSARHYILITVIFFLLFGGFLFAYPHIKHQSDYFSYFPSDDRIIADTKFINRHSGGSQTFNITLNAPDGQASYFLDPKVLNNLDVFETAVSENFSVANKLSFLGILKSMNKAVSGDSAVPDSRGLILLLDRYFRMIPTGKIALGQGSSVISEDGSSVTIYLKLTDSDSYNMLNEDGVREFISFIEAELESAFDESMNPNLWGSTILLLDSSWLIKHDQFQSTLLSILLGILITAIVFKSFTYSLLAIIPLLSGMFWYFLTLYVSGIPLDMTTILVTNVTVGVGLDDAVHFILQYRNQRRQNDWKKALQDSLRITGRPIILTTLSLVAGLMMLCFASFKPVIYFGYLVAGTLFSTMIGTMVFIPAAIVYHEKIQEWKAKRKVQTVQIVP